MTGTEISLIDPSALTGDDAMAFKALSRAANAILSVPSAIVEIAGLRQDLKWVSEERDTLRATEANQAQRIALLEAQLDSALRSESDTRQAYIDMRDERDARQEDINKLDHTVAKLSEWREAETARADAFRRDYEQTFDAYTLAQTKLEKMQRILGALTEDEVEEVPEPEPEPNALQVCEESSAMLSSLDHNTIASPDPIGDGLDDPNYRREAEPEATRAESDHTGERIDYDHSDKLEQIAFHD